MRRAAIALAIVAGTLVPAFVATAWLFGCCVLPFHHAIHRLVPLCRIAIAMAHDADRTDRQASSTPQKKQRTAQPPATELARASRALFAPRSFPVVSLSPAAYRSFITLGAIRCDRDVGLHTLFATFLI
jgi:hypothetical protein